MLRKLEFHDAHWYFNAMRTILRKPLLGFTVLLAFQWIGEALSALLHLPIPGAVVGMVLLFLALLAYGRAPGSLQNASQTLLGNLGLLFVPAAVGALLKLSGLLDQAFAFLILIVVSTLVTLAVTAGLMQWLNSRTLR